MANKFKEQESNKKILQSVLASKDTEHLLKVKNFIDLLLKYKKTAKLYDTYVKGTKSAILKVSDSKVYCEYRLSDVVTGRLSCAAYTAGRGNSLGVSFHTLPRETEYNIRNIFTGPSGYEFITADFKAMEMRVMAHSSNDANMIKALLSGEDLHTYSASLVFKKKLEDITKHERQLAKATSFLIIYGGGEYTLAKNFNIPISHAAKIIKDYRAAFPDIFTYMSACENEILYSNQITSMFGRVRHLPNIQSQSPSIRNQAIRQGINFTIQSAASDILLMAMVGLQNEFKAKQMQSRTVGIVHDSIEVVCPSTERIQALELIHKHMVSNPTLKSIFNIDFKVPFEIDVEIGTSFGSGARVDYSEYGVSNFKAIEEYFNAI